MAFADEERQTHSSSFASRVIHFVTTLDNICLALWFHLWDSNLRESLFLCVFPHLGIKFSKEDTLDAPEAEEREEAMTMKIETVLKLVVLSFSPSFVTLRLGGTVSTKSSTAHRKTRWFYASMVYKSPRMACFATPGPATR